MGGDVREQGDDSTGTARSDPRSLPPSSRGCSLASPPTGTPSSRRADASSHLPWHRHPIPRGTAASAWGRPPSLAAAGVLCPSCAALGFRTARRLRTLGRVPRMAQRSSPSIAGHVPPLLLGCPAPAAPPVGEGRGYVESRAPSSWSDRRALRAAGRVV